MSYPAEKGEVRQRDWPGYLKPAPLSFRKYKFRSASKTESRSLMFKNLKGDNLISLISFGMFVLQDRLKSAFGPCFSTRYTL